METTRQKLTQKIVREYLGMLGARLRRNAEYGEHVLAAGKDTYFSTDLEDAIGTARIMLGGHERFEDAEAHLALMTGEVR